MKFTRTTQRTTTLKTEYHDCEFRVDIVETAEMREAWIYTEYGRHEGTDVWMPEEEQDVRGIPLNG